MPPRPWKFKSLVFEELGSANNRLEQDLPPQRLEQPITRAILRLAHERVDAVQSQLDRLYERVASIERRLDL